MLSIVLEIVCVLAAVQRKKLVECVGEVMFRRVNGISHMPDDIIRRLAVIGGVCYGNYFLSADWRYDIGKVATA